jgi:multidrug resistance efflux pump
VIQAPKARDDKRHAIALAQAEAVLEGERSMLDQANADLKRYSALTPDLVISKQKMDHVVLEDAVFVGAVVGIKPPTPHEIGTQSCRFLRQQISARGQSARLTG